MLYGLLLSKVLFYFKCGHGVLYSNALQTDFLFDFQDTRRPNFFAICSYRLLSDKLQYIRENNGIGE